MSKRSRVRAALHSELEEYASLVRALRTSKTLDLASHLTQYSQTQTQTQQSASEGSSSQQSTIGYEDDEEEGSNDLPRTSSVPPASDVYDEEDGEEEIDYDIETANDKGKRRATSKTKGKNKRRTTSFNERDIWTRWPLLSGDVHVPTWGLDDEVAALSTNILQVHRLSASVPASPSSTAPQDLGEVIDPEVEEILDNNDDEDERKHLTHLATSTAFILSQLLSTLAQYVPRVEKSLRNRLAPLDWSTVLRAAKAGDLGLDPSSIERLERRLMSLYDPSNVVQIKLEAVPPLRHQQATECIKALTTRYNEEEGGLLTFYGPPVPRQPAKPRKKRKQRIGTTHSIELTVNHVPEPEIS